jgi:replicative DNA helicase
LDRASESVNYLTLEEKLKHSRSFAESGAALYLDKIIDYTPAADVESAARIIAQKSRLRRLIGLCQDVSAKAFSESHEPDELVEKAEREIFDLTRADRNSSYAHCKDVADETFIRISEAYKNKLEGREVLRGVPSGIPDLDKLTYGFQDSDFIVLGARPSVGKTAFCLQMAMNAILQDYPTVVYSLEMPAQQLMFRLFAMHSRVSAESMKKGHLSKTQSAKLARALAHLSEAPLYINDKSSITLYEIRNDVRRLAKELTAKGSELRMIIIDYLQLISSTERRQNEQERISEISRGLKGIAREFNVPLICLSQLSRKVEDRADKRPMLSDLRESGAIEQDADLVMFLHRPDYYDKKTPEIQGLAEIILAKHRNGSTGDVMVRFNKETTSFEQEQTDF